MPLSIEGSASGAWSSGTTVVLSGLTTTGSNEPIILFAEKNSGVDITSVTSANLAFTRRTKTTAFNNIEEWSATAAGPLTSEVITVTYGAAPSFAEAHAFGILGAPASSYFDTNASIPVEDSTTTAPTFSTTGANTLVFGAIRSGVATPTPGTGWTAAFAGNFLLVQYQVFSSAQSGTTFAVGSDGTVNGWLVDAVVAASGGAAPTVTSVNAGAAITEGAVNVPVVGTGFAAGMTSNLLQPGGVSVAQPTTFTDATDATFNLSMEPGAGSQLAFTDATYTTTATVTTTSGGTSAAISITLTPPAGLIFETLASINPTSSYRITAIPDLSIGDQLEAAGNSSGTAAAPTGLTLNNDATFLFTAGNTPVAFWVRAYDGSGKVWGAWAQQSIPSPSSGSGKMLLMGVG